MKAQIISILENGGYINIPVVFLDSGRTLTLSSKRTTFMKLNGNIPDDQVKKTIWDISYCSVTGKSRKTGNPYTYYQLIDMTKM